MTEDAEELLRDHLTREKLVVHPPLKSKQWKLIHERARAAGKVTKPPAKPSKPAKSTKPTTKQSKAMTKADRALRRMYERAEPGRCHTLHEIAEVMGITRERVRQIEQRAKKNFRNRLTILLKSEGVTPEDLSAVLDAANLEPEQTT